jgi:type II restriction/modification system DNA methylase subunit YeeA
MSSSSVADVLTPLGFISKWSRNTQTEKQIAHAHFEDLCRLLRHPTPAEDDPIGDHFAFEKRATRIGGGKGYADVWKKDYFAWEYKSRNENLDQAHKQLMTYAPALGSPPLQVVCDFKRYRVHTAWTNTVPETHELVLEDFVKPDRLGILWNVFHNPEKLKPVRVRSALTKEAADKFATIAFRLQGRGTTEEIAHFVNQLVFCFFADSVGLLPKGLWSKLLDRAQKDPAGAKKRFDTLFLAMQRGEDYGAESIVHFNGGLFDGQPALSLGEDDIGLLRAANSLDWSQIDPSIFGSLFERFLDPEKRAQIGAHYTDAEKIQKIIEPVILRPLKAEWEQVKTDIAALATGKKQPPMRLKPKRRMKPLEAAEERRAQFLKRLKEIRILDPACGSGNFLYLALQGVKDIEHRVNLDSEMMGLKPQLPFIGPEILKGIEINPVAAELARTTIWIGDIQWRMRNGIHSEKRPVLQKLDSIERRDAIVTLRNNGAPTEAIWPEAEFIVGNPPFLGGKLMRTGLSDNYVETLFCIYKDRVPPEADLVLYWFDKAHNGLNIEQAKRVGFVATNSIRGGANRRVVDGILKDARIFTAWSDEAWVVDGAAVRVSLLCFSKDGDQPELDGIAVAGINSDLTSGATDLTKARRLIENGDVAYMGDTKGGGFDIPGELARSWLTLPTNPNGRSNSDVLRPWRNGMDLTRRASDKWILDFGWQMSERDASLFEVPFQYAQEKIWPERSKNRRETYRRNWWRHVEARVALRIRLAKCTKYICTPRVSKYRLFVWLDACVVPDSATIAIIRDDDATFGILHSRFHESWSLRLGTWLGVGNDPRYTPTTTFETFPFPEGLTPNIPAKDYADDPLAVAIANAAKRLDELRNAWLNPAELIDVVPEIVPGYPDRILPKNVVAVAELKKRTLTNLYNQRPQWLADAHRDLDAAVAAAYGWPADISEEDALSKLLELNLSRAVVQGSDETKEAGESLDLD